MLITSFAIQLFWKKKKKKKGKTSKKLLFWAQFAQKSGHYGPRPKWKTIFWAEITKADRQLSETFYFIKISYVLARLWIFFYLELCFFVKKVPFPIKTADKEICPVSLLKTVLLFLTNQGIWFCSCGIVYFIFSREIHVAIP